MDVSACISKYMYKYKSAYVHVSVCVYIHKLDYKYVYKHGMYVSTRETEEPLNPKALNPKAPKADLQAGEDLDDMGFAHGRSRSHPRPGRRGLSNPKPCTIQL